MIDEKMLLFDPNEEEDPFFYHGKKQGRRDLNKRVRKNQNFAFDVVYNQASTNAQVFEGTTKDLVETVISGYNCSVFAYGATGAGKTFTMLGSKVIICPNFFLGKTEKLCLFCNKYLFPAGLSWDHIPDHAGDLQPNCKPRDQDLRDRYLLLGSLQRDG